MKGQRICFFLIVWLTMFSGEIFTQEKNSNIFQNSPVKGSHLQEVVVCDESMLNKLVLIGSGTALKNTNVKSLRISPRSFEPKFSSKKLLQEPGCGGKQVSFKLVNLPTVSTYTQSLGIICKTELKMDKISPIPLRLRLGSLEYVNWMEQKPNAVKGW